MQNEMLEEFYNAEQIAKTIPELPEIIMAKEKPKQEKKYNINHGEYKEK